MTSNAAHQTLAQETLTNLRSAASLLQRKCACGNHTIAAHECDSCNKQGAGSTLQRVAAHAESVDEVPSIVHEVLRSPGQPLDAVTRTFMEPRFGHDFSRVRVHTDAHAAQSALVVNSLAYTVGRDVVFGAGQYRPSTSAGRQLLAHELTHIVQQGGGQPVGISNYGSAKGQEQIEVTFAGALKSASPSMHPRSGIAPRSLGMSHPQDAAEVEADRVANVIATNSRLGVNVSAVDDMLRLQRQPDPDAPKRTPLDECRRQNLFAMICDRDQSDREEVVTLFLINEGYEHDGIGAMKFEKQKEFERGTIRECENGPGASWHCTVNVRDKGTKKQVIVSLFACLCCDKESGKTSLNWNGPHWSGRNVLDEKVKPKKPGN